MTALHAPCSRLPESPNQTPPLESATPKPNTPDRCVQARPIAFKTFADVKDCTVKLQIIADWRDELQRKLDRASLQFELGELTAEELQVLTREVREFRQICHGLAEYLGRGTT